MADAVMATMMMVIVVVVVVVVVIISSEIFHFHILHRTDYRHTKDSLVKNGPTD